ncbi:sugar-transfer associated ATP-grasp domain-containing protein [Pararhodobacter sp. SW119]|uniref:sugar-transfer associated ATP-grasp domain-containing protein n=1 Tax=Pararhodobacter sp. SW119 TaxID=2780075 RepID=UPI001ADF4489|nr:sugar-transfer associated ATP-grasp domain-containing protein [Pararhodobacter sp. SW119]
MFWLYRNPPTQYLRYGLYLKTAPSDWKERLPHPLIFRLQKSLNPAEAIKFAEDKRLFRERMEAAGLPTIREVFTVDAAGMTRDPDGQELAPGDAAALIREGEFFSKPIDGIQGKEARLVRPGDDVEAFVADARKVIVQPRIRQHPLLHRLSPHSVNTVRIDTLRVGKAWINSAAVLKAGVGDSIVDNGSAGGVFVGIDLESGTLQAIGRQKTKFSTAVYERHPDTGVVFEDFVVPHWALLRETVTRAAEVMLPLQTLGWDVAITEDGVLLLEANHNWDPDIFEIGWGGLADTPVGRMACELHGLKPRKEAGN